MTISKIEYGVIYNSGHPKVLASFATMQEAKNYAKYCVNVYIKPISIRIEL